MQIKPVVFVVDDDAALRDSVRFLVESVNLGVETFGSAAEFLTRAEHGFDAPSCLVLDVRMPQMSGLELLERLSGLGLRVPAIVVTAYGDIKMAVRAMRSGAIDLVEKPFNDQELLERIQHAIALDERHRAARAEQSAVAARIATLTSRESQVMDLVVSGRENRAIAADLGISDRTVEVHRMRIMQKMRARNAVDLTRMVLTARGMTLPETPAAELLATAR